MNTPILAIDPGASGGIAYIDDRGGANCIPMPESNGDILMHLRSIGSFADTCYIEQVASFVAFGGASQMFNFGKGVGYIEGALDALGFTVVKVRPQTWQKWVNIGGRIGKQRADEDASTDSKHAVDRHNQKVTKEFKNRLKMEAQRRFPGLHITLKTADACLLLDYARQHP